MAPSRVREEGSTADGWRPRLVVEALAAERCVEQTLVHRAPKDGVGEGRAARVANLVRVASLLARDGPGMALGWPETTPRSRALSCRALRVYGHMSRTCPGHVAGLWRLVPLARTAPRAALAARRWQSCCRLWRRLARSGPRRRAAPVTTIQHAMPRLPQAAAVCVELRREGRSELEQRAISAVSRLYLAARGEVPHPSSSSEPRPGNAAASSGRTCRRQGMTMMPF